MNSLSVPLTCPHCPGSTRKFSPHGLKIHIGRKHRDLSRPLTQGTSTPQIITQTPLQAVHPHLDELVVLRENTPVLRHVPKGARNLAAGKLCEIINKCVDDNGVEDWMALLSFAFRALRVPSKALPGNMTLKVKTNIESSATAQRSDCESMSTNSRQRTIHKIIESKVFEGDLRGAVRLLVSNDSFAKHSPDTLAALQNKHPAPSRTLHFPTEPDTSFIPLSVTVEEVSLALNSFYSGSAAGIDGIRPGHLKELTSLSAGENGRRLMESLTRLSNFLLSGQLNLEVCPFLYGATLCALEKKDGGVRPIAVGSVFRRLSAKLACQSVRDEMALCLQPRQLGFGTRQGCEAAIHATRAFVLKEDNSECIVLKLDIRNAFNTLERDVMLGEVKEKTPSLYPFLYQAYASSSNLFFKHNLIHSQVGVQQGDPLGPLAFSLAIHKVITDLSSPLNVWYLDDGTIGGTPDVVARDLQVLIPRLKELGLEVNPSKCEFFPCSNKASAHFSSFSRLLPGLKELSPSSFSLLGSPIFLEGVPEAISCRENLLSTANERLSDLSAHVALILLRMCFALPKLTYLLRTTPTWLCPAEVAAFDCTLKSSVESILNVCLDEQQWSQASLPISLGGLGIRRACDVGLPAFLASAHGVSNLVANILPSNGNGIRIPFVSEALSAWSAINPEAAIPSVTHAQRAWDEIGSTKIVSRLVDNATGADLARLLAVSRSESGAWLHALPSPHLGTLLDDDSLRVAVALRLGCKVCEPHKCTCGSMVEADGHHALSCRRCTGRFPRHHALNDIIRRAFISANIPCTLEPPGLSRSDGKRPDGLTLVPWSKGKSVVWDATCVSTVAASHVARTAHIPAAAAEDAASKKRAKYAALEPQYLIVPFAVETMGSWGTEALKLVAELGLRLRNSTGDSRSGSFLMQRIAIAIQRGNAASVMGTFASGTKRGGLFD